MKLSKIEFDILIVMITKPKELLSTSALSNLTGLDVLTIDNIVLRLTYLKLICNGLITTEGQSALEPYKVKHAIIMAAGFGSRLLPATLNIPKPLVLVKGIRMIDTLIDALIKIEIYDITIVRGYLGEQFDQLLFKYPMLKFVDNKIYDECNNISSAMCVRNEFSNSYIMDADFMLYNPDILKKYHFISNYLVIPTEFTDDWCFETINGIIKKVHLGGKNCYHWLGISYWSEDDGKKLNGHIKKTYDMPNGHGMFWDQVALECFASEYEIGVSKCIVEDILEIDSYSELKKADPSYI